MYRRTYLSCSHSRCWKNAFIRNIRHLISKHTWISYKQTFIYTYIYIRYILLQVQFMYCWNISLELWFLFGYSMLVYVHANKTESNTFNVLFLATWVRAAIAHCNNISDRRASFTMQCDCEITISPSLSQSL